MKRIFIQLVFVVSLLLSSIATASNFPTEEPVGGKPFGYSTTNIGDGLYVFRWWVYRNIFLVTDEGVIVTDPMNPRVAKQLLGEIRKITDKPIKYVIYSHNHHDHISGGKVFKDQGATFIGHKNVLKELGDHPSYATPLPDITFEDEYTVQLGGRTIELKYFGPNHGDSLVVMRLPKEKILFVVDIVTPRRVAFRSMPDFWPDEWIRSLKEIEQMDIDYVISAHGPETQPAIDLASAVKDQRVYLEDLMTAVKKAMDSGTHSPDALRKTVKLPKYENWQYYKEWLPMNIERIWAYYHMGW
ncbi:MAG: MBL fold metallo-hydrolase [Gammaproteobacteria bacterium]|jgi:glyoxylase-like metal-dependent hydrolase (beta-lactamase superfamily II)|nr:MBL fold metallo-hydrolase [Gammaproteobacteria bacterium]MBT3723836.1 MBL fold metallo-hydrolase [Gammaproteobacteria bacterium]MBT4193750.1 MBL fold metallo-hydrolase [Gammaproteobacteria bacterium]MBT4451893.1 MBL fold metallo-hydrolase [Gammaproteobacteria bacterium]MBT4861961.1 MBL fold metallo-hydrolase [Gammaproteobacteria bacterium]